jgi:5-formyltetrahydrofolate cyclo-ligase
MSELPFAPEEVAAIVVQVKRELRKRMRSLRGALSSATRAEKSSVVVDRLAELELFEGAKTVGLYAPMVDRGELDVEPLHQRLAARGVVVAYPTMNDDGSLAFYRVDDPSSLVERGNLFREPEPDADRRVSSLDVLVLPALAADPLGNRLGYGGGSYDRTLAAFPVRPRTVAVVYDFQVLVEVPHVATDIPVDAVVTDRRVFSRSAP